MKKVPTHSSVYRFSRSWLLLCDSSFADKLVQPDQTPDGEMSPDLRAIRRYEGVLRRIMHKFQVLVLPPVPSTTSSSASSVFSKRVVLLRDCVREALEAIPWLKDTSLDLDEKRQVVKMVTSVLYVLVVYPLYDFGKGVVRWYLPDSSDIYGTRHQFGFWLEYWQNMKLTFTQASLLLQLAFIESISSVLYSPTSSDMRSEQVHLVALLKEQMAQCTSSDDSPCESLSSRWLLMERNYKFNLQGMFECGSSCIGVELDRVDALGSVAHPKES